MQTKRPAAQKKQKPAKKLHLKIETTGVERKLAPSTPSTQNSSSQFTMSTHVGQ